MVGITDKKHVTKAACHRVLIEGFRSFLAHFLNEHSDIFDNFCTSFVGTNYVRWEPHFEIWYKSTGIVSKIGKKQQGSS